MSGDTTVPDASEYAKCVGQAGEPRMATPLESDALRRQSAPAAA